MEEEIKSEDKIDTVIWSIKSSKTKQYVNVTEDGDGTFEKVMIDNFAGWNIPFKIVNGVKEEWEIAFARVEEYLKKNKS